MDGIFFVVDSTDTERLSIAKELIDSCIADPCKLSLSQRSQNEKNSVHDFVY